MDDINSTVIMLIPKVQSPRSMGDYRPISLCHVIYKVIVMTITNRLRGVLDRIISEAQCAFISGRLISNNPIFRFECLSRIKRRKRKRGSIAIKLDMFKAYDRVEWGFIEQMMGKVGFLKKWRQLIWNFISTVSYSYRLNEEVCGNIKPTRHGDPLSSYLFVICTEGHSSLIRGHKIRGRLWVSNQAGMDRSFRIFSSRMIVCFSQERILVIMRPLRGCCEIILKLPVN
ncbi:hypothetical protein Ddye_005074 [Dipteronia dyeriana]|uniref:Reverse transcriptase domain-containing protein n=1 Tax=Dipteronia dyeriana TaxID=168575 RepID=A0AAE0CPD1_9ROSI|nr:hypothetical protein Ddye_005074 [Dipteronia dyeriana]